MKKEHQEKYANIFRNCDYCKREYKTYRSDRASQTCASRFCSHTCYGKNKKRPFILKNGYKMITLLGHHRANNRGYVREHIVVMEKKLGRLISKTESVHHIDGDKLNNHPDNLELFASHREHLLHEWSNNTLRKTKIGSRQFKN